MGLKQVKEEILNEAQRKSKEIEKEGDEEAEEIIEKAEEKAEEIIESSKKEIREEKERLEKKQISKAKMDAKKKVQRTKEKSLKKTFSEFHQKLESLNEEERENFLDSAEQQANFNIGTIKASKEFESIVDEEKFEEISRRGVILESEKGEKSLNLTFDQICEDYKKNNRGNIAQILFKEV